MSVVSDRRDSQVHLMRAWVLKPVVRFLADAGCPVERYLVRSHIAPELLEYDEAPVPIRSAIAFTEAASRAEGIDHIGLRTARAASLEDFGQLAALFASSRNLHAYLHAACKLVSSIATNARYALSIEGEAARFSHITVGTPDSYQGHLLTLGVTIDTIRALAGPSWIPDEVTLPSGDVSCLGDVHETFARARLEPDRGCASFTFPARLLLERPAKIAGVRVSGSAPMRGTLAAGGFGQRARRVVEGLVLGGAPNVCAAAESVGLSVRTLQRRLQEQGMGFSQLVLEARMDWAERWLREDGRPVKDIARALGYSDAANFTRAFRRANGVSPTTYVSRVIGA